MHRWMLLKSSGPVLPCHPAATASCRRRASGVTRGIRPSARVHDQRGAVVEHAVDHPQRTAGRRPGGAVGVDIVERGGERGVSRRVGASPVPEDPVRPCLQRGDLFVAQTRSAGQGRRPFQRGGAVAEPDALQVRLPIGRPRQRPWVARRRLPGGRQWDKRHDQDQGHQCRETSMLHGTLFPGPLAKLRLRPTRQRAQPR